MKKGFTLWWGLLITILLSVPIIAAILEIGNQAAKLAYISNHAVAAFFILIIVKAFIWKVLQAIEQASGQLGNLTSSLTGRAQKALSDYRKDTMKRRSKEAISGQRDIFGARMATRLMRRASLAEHGGFSLLPGGRSRYRNARQAMLDQTANEMLKRDGGRVGGDDDAMELAMQKHMDDGTFRSEYAARLQERGVGAAEAQRRAAVALGGVRANFGQFGTDAMRVAAYKSLLNSKTSYTDSTGANGQQVMEEMFGDGAALVNDGLMTTTDVVMAIKQRGDRSDRAGIGFGTALNQIERSVTRYQQGARVGASGPGAVGPLVTQQEAQNMRQEALFGTGPGAIVGGRHEAVSALSGTMTETVQTAANNFDTALNAANAIGVHSETDAQAILNSPSYQAWLAGGRVGPLTAQQQAATDVMQMREQYDRQLAAVAARYEVMKQVSPQNAEIMANNVMSQMIADPVTGERHTIQVAIEQARSRPRYQEMNREYMSATSADAARMAGALAGGGAPGAMPPPTGP